MVKYHGLGLVDYQPPPLIVRPQLNGVTLGGRERMRDLRGMIVTLEAALASIPESALRIFGDWVAPFERRFDYTFRPVACSATGSVLNLSLGSAGDLVIQDPTEMSISPAAFRIPSASSVRLNGAVIPGGPGTPTSFYVIEYRVDGSSITRRDGTSWRSFPLTRHADSLASSSFHPRAQQAIAAVARSSTPRATSCLSPVVKYHGLGLVDHQPPPLIVRPQLNGGTLGGRT